MRELRLNRELYRGEAIDQAVKLYERFAKFELTEEPEHWVVKVEASSEKRARRVADELANYALGLTMEDRGRES